MNRKLVKLATNVRRLEQMGRWMPDRVRLTDRLSCNRI